MTAPNSPTPDTRGAWTDAQIEAMRKDAARYRWLRNQATDGFMGTPRYGSLNCDEPESEWDAWIDSAMSQEGEG